MTMLFRAAKNDDLDAIYQLATSTGPIGITTLPKDKNLLKKRLSWSTDSFKKAVHSPLNEYYLFVLEDTEKGHIVGTSAIEAAIGSEAPFYSYKISNRTRICHELKIRNDYEVLSLVNDNQGNSEICTLFLDSNYRRQQNGLLLSRARFLFLAQFPNRFAPVIVAEMRGISDEKGNSPFWDAIGHHFFQMSFAEADRLTIATNKQFIADLMPRNLIYMPLLPPSAQAVIGKPHESTVPAMKILLREGFHYNHYIDIFDGGPIIEAPRDQIHTAASSKSVTLKKIVQEANSPTFIIANTQLDYRALVGQVVLDETQASCILAAKTAELLHVNCGDIVRIAPLEQGNRL